MAEVRFCTKLRWTKAWLLACCMMAVHVNASTIHSSSVSVPPSTNNSSAVSVVSGESWLDHLHRSFGETSMGKTGRLGPSTALAENQPLNWSAEFTAKASNRMVTLHGSDLYRLNCQGCHGEAGLGAPPEIGSVINPVRATSAALVMERMKKSGMDISRTEASQLASQSQAALLKRLHTGGQDMPAFPQLNDAEIQSLIAYLKQLADMPGAAKQQLAVRESPVRVGELIVKSTCHTCHSAEGPNPSPEQLLRGAIPPLNTLTMRANQLQLVQKVTRGARINMGTPPVPYRGRMPVFFYLSANEAADVYEYLTDYKPSAASTSAAIGSSLPPDQPGNPPSQNILAASFPPRQGTTTSDKGFDLRILGPVGLFVTLLLVTGVIVTVREFQKLSEENEIRRWELRSKRLRVLRQTVATPIRVHANSNMKYDRSKPEKRQASRM
jgi:mono/diheme cytochrome c family protein